MHYPKSSPEKIIRVQSLSDNGGLVIPNQYVKIPSEIPSITPTTLDMKIPVINMQSLMLSEDPIIVEETEAALRKACQEWGIFMLVGHGIDLKMMAEFRKKWKEFFYLPLDKKEIYSNSKWSEEGYGSKFGRAKGANEDWNDNFFLHLQPAFMRDVYIWPKCPSFLEKMIEKYGEDLVKLAGTLVKTLSKTLGLGENKLLEGLGGEKIGAHMRVNFYSKCPQPDLTLGASAHSDPSALTILLADDIVSGLQVLKEGKWIPVEPVADAFIVNIGDQIEFLSNGGFKSPEHRVLVNSVADRISIAYFYNPNGEQIIEPIKELITESSPAAYIPETYNNYINRFVECGLSGKSLVKSRKVMK